MNGRFQRTAVAVVAAALLAGMLTTTPSAQAKPDFTGYSGAAEEAVNKMLRALRGLDTYSDKAIYKVDTDFGFGRRGGDNKMNLTFAKGGRFHLATNEYDVVSDGKKLTVYSRNLRRYTQTPIKPASLPEQLKPYLSSGRGGVDFSIIELMITKDAAKLFAQRFKHMQVGARVDVNGESCYLLQGDMTYQTFGESGEAPVTLYISQRDSLPRKIELDLKDMMKERFSRFGGGRGGFGGSMEKYLAVYDLKDVKFNEPIDKRQFQFEAPSAAKKVNRFYNNDPTTARSAQQFELSGKPAPAFDLQTTLEEPVSLDTYRGGVIVLQFQPAFRWGGRRRQVTAQALQQISDDLQDKDASFFVVFPGDDADDLVEQFAEDDILLPVLLDEDRSVTRQYIRDRFGAGVVLIGKDGTVQGKYTNLQSKDLQQAIRNDINQLLAGKTLDSGKPMSEDEIYEAADQRSARFTRASAEPLNEKRLNPKWEVRTMESAQSFAFGGRGSSGGRRSRGDDALWVRDGKKIKAIDAQGKVFAEIEMPDASTDGLQQGSFAVGEISRRLAVVYIVPPAGSSGFGFGRGFGRRGGRSNNGENNKTTIIASSEGGSELWRLEVKLEGFQQPGNLSMANLDGRPGDEVAFTQGGAVWIVDSRGEVVCRKPFIGQARWLEAADKDRDGRGELYLRTSTKVIRFDYDGRK